MKYLLIVSLFFSFTFSLSAQASPDSLAADSRRAIHWAPLSLWQLRPRIRIGMTWTKSRVAKSLDLELNGPTNGITYGAPCPVGLPLKYFIGIQPEIRLYRKKRPKDGIFAGLTGLLNYSKSQVSDYVYLSDEGFSVDDADRNDLRLALVAKAGYTFPLGKGSFIEIYTGVGGGLGHFSYENYGSPIGEDEYAQCGHSIRHVKKTDLRGEFQLGFKIGAWLTKQ